MTKHLYIHIPFCKKICTYCDFCRIKIAENDPNIDIYIGKVIDAVKSESEFNQYQTIYLGGGTPNFLSDNQLKLLLSTLKPYLDTNNAYEFCLECNPEFITYSQAQIFMANGINRISLGVQTTNNDILKSLERTHTIEDVNNAIQILHEVGIDNISCDFIYAIEKLTEDDIINSIEFIIKNNIKHVSYYALEIKPGSILAKQNYIVDEEIEANQLEYINNALELNGFKRYEVSNWSVSKQYESLHNKAYWLTNDWKAIGYGASGFENKNMYKWEGSILEWQKDSHTLTTAELYTQVLMMGLRLVEGIEVIKNKRNSEAYATYFDDIINCYIRDGYLIVKNLNILHETLVNIIDEGKEEQLKNSKHKIFEEIDD